MKSFFFYLVVIIQLLVIIYSRSINENESVIKDESENENLKTSTFNVIFNNKDEYHDKPIEITEYNGTFNDTGAIIINAKPSKTSLLSNRISSKNEYHRNELNEIERLIYDNLLEFLSSNSSIVSLFYKFVNLKYYEINEKDFKKYLVRGLFNLKEDHPEIWFTNNHSIMSLNYKEEGDKKIVSEACILLKSDFNVYEINKKNLKIKTIADKIAKKAQTFPTMYEKLLYIHDYLAKNIKYFETSQDQNIYGALVEKHCVCTGYATSFAYLSRLIGAEVIVVSGNKHAWNYVKLDSKWYAVDVTWDDSKTDYIGDDFNMIHSYFLVGNETIVEDNKKYGDSKIRDLSNPNNTYYAYVFPTLSETAYKVPSVDLNEKVNYEECKERLKNRVTVTIEGNPISDTKELNHYVCAPSKNNPCRYDFEDPNDETNFIKCAHIMNQRLLEDRYYQTICYWNHLDHLDNPKSYCIKNERPSIDPNIKKDYGDCRIFVEKKILIINRGDTKFPRDELAHAVCTPIQGNYCRYYYDETNYLKCTESINNVLKSWGNESEVCFTHETLGNHEFKCYNNGRDPLEEYDFEECWDRISEELQIENEDDIVNYLDIERLAESVCKNKDGNYCRYSFDYRPHEKNYHNFVRCAEDINNELVYLGYINENCIYHTLHDDEKQCFRNNIDPKDKKNSNACKSHLTFSLLIEPKGYTNVTIDIDELTRKVCLPKKGNHCRYEFGPPEEKENYNNFIECVEDINNVLNDQGNDKKMCYMHIDYSNQWHCFENRRDSNDEVNYEQCKKRIKEEIEIEIGTETENQDEESSEFNLEELAHRVCTPTEGNRCRYHFDYPGSGVKYNYFLKCTLDMTHVFRSWGYENDICFFHKKFSDEKKCYKK